MSVRAKMTLQSITENAYGSKSLKFNCTYCPEVPEDQRFQKATPWGELSLGIDNPKAIEQFRLGEAYYVDFSPVPPLESEPS